MLPDASLGRKIVQEVTRSCEICQANEHPHESTKFPIKPTPIFPVPMDNIAVDVFYMNPITFEGREYDALILIVDRLTGWITAFPENRKGLTASRVARQTIFHHWDLFGVPRVVVSDKGPQFASSFWKTLCSLLGVQNAFCHVGHHQGNGRAEVAGKVLKNFMRKISTEKGLNWVETLPIALRLLRSAPGESGYSPHELLFGREALRPGIPMLPTRECEEASEFVRRISDLHVRVAKIMNDLHAHEFEVLNSKRRTPEPFKVGQKVWVLRPRGLSAEKLRSWWIGPCVVTDRFGESSHEVEVKPGFRVSFHRSKMKPHFEDEFSDERLELHHFSPLSEDFDSTPDEWEVDKILRHRVGKGGRLEFLTKWKGWDDATWEPLMNFIHRFSSDWRDYVAQKKLKFNLIDYLKPHESHGRNQ